MIAGYFHQGSGLGNQLFRYTATRTLAEDKGYEWGMIHSELFKGSSFMKLNTGQDVSTTILGRYMDNPTFEGYEMFHEKKVVENGVDIRGYDPEFNFIKDDTIIDGEFQDERYWKHKLPEMREWFKVEPLEMPDDLCVIGFRGGEYTVFPELFLTKDYWNEAIARMRKINPKMKFEVHTDDPITAKQFFPDFPIIQDIGLNWRSIRYAKHLIIANSSFYILPSLLNEAVNEVIAPRYWARRNTRTWALPQNFYSDKRWQYI